jgi:Flp pilus assembly protein TadG
MRQRQRAQTFVIAALAMSTMLGALSMVVDAGVYFVIQRQLQNAADAAALAAVWYDPACPSGNPAWLNAGCQSSAPGPAPVNCQSSPQPPNPPYPYDPRPCTAATQEVLANQNVALSLCAGPNLPTGQIPVNVVATPGTPLNVPQVSTYIVTVSCDAPHWFGRIFPSVALTMHISSSASAALGWLDTNGRLKGGASQPTPTTPLVARLII